MPGTRDVYFKKTVPFDLDGQHFEFDVSQMLFSSYQVDTGTSLLLRAITAAEAAGRDEPRSILDLGCGYGPLGVVLARRHPGAHVTLVDADLLAVRYARRNCALNGVEATTEVTGSVGLDGAPAGPYDLIVSNVPAKIGDAAIEQDFLLGPLGQLSEHGEYWFVVVSALNRLIPGLGRTHELDLKQMGKRSGHSIYRLRRR
ncbi:MAG: methyltransferase [Dehalococcoidia bacterium]|nr:methyltransferase [Dehalococcoidia bacterium]